MNVRWPLALAMATLIAASHHGIAGAGWRTRAKTVRLRAAPQGPWLNVSPLGLRARTRQGLFHPIPVHVEDAPAGQSTAYLSVRATSALQELRDGVARQLR